MLAEIRRKQSFGSLDLRPYVGGGQLDEIGVVISVVADEMTRRRNSFTTFGLAATFWPTMKNVALIPYLARVFKTRSVEPDAARRRRSDIRFARSLCDTRE